MRILGVIPARYQSTRFPGKPLADINGKPMIIRVAELGAQAISRQDLFVATDDDRIREVVTSFGFQAIMTSSHCLTGTDRLVEVAEKIDADIYVNIQGDEPMIDPNDISQVIKCKRSNPDMIINAMCALKPDEDPLSTNIPKVVVDQYNKLLYMSRAPIPGSKNLLDYSSYLKQVCIYAFNKKELEAFGSVDKKTRNEVLEDIEILRFLDLGFKIQMIEVSESSVAVDTPEDLSKVRLLLAE